MDQTRRDFFGVIAAPLYRRVLPAVPMASGGIVPHGCRAIVHECNLDFMRLALRNADGTFTPIEQVRSIITAGTPLYWSR